MSLVRVTWRPLAKWALPVCLAWGLSACGPTPQQAQQALTPVQASEARTAYPIVLVHGMMGFVKLGPLRYWPGIQEALEAHGAQVYVPQISAFNSSELRGEQLLSAVVQYTRDHRVAKVHLIGHSQGSQAARYVAAKRPDLVASVTAVAGPTFGSETADWVQGLQASHPWTFAALMGTGNGLGRFINWVSGTPLPQDTRATLWSLSSRGAADFNQRFPDGVPTDPCGQGSPQARGVRLYSWGGVGRFYNALNPADYLMALTGLTFQREANDGLVGRCASHFGEVLRDDLPLNHFQMVNQFFGLVGAGADPVSFYLAHARRLKAAGL